MHFIRIISIAALSVFFLTKCANIIPPTGGPKDKEPPVLKGSIPKEGTTNFHSDKITLFFNEAIQAQIAPENIFITPRMEKKPNIKANRKSLVITFKEPLKPNTTYTINLNEAVKDVNEGNTINDIKFSFSTGPMLDSLSLEGIVKDHLTNRTEENAVVALYHTETDTTNISNSKPYYFTYTNKNGHFLLTNLHEGIYDLYALQEANKNLKYDVESEKIYFRKNLNLDSSISGLILPIAKIDTAKPIIVNSKTTVTQYIVNFNEGLIRAEALGSDSNSYLTTLEDKGKTLVIYKEDITQPITDSIPMRIVAEDTAGNILNKKEKFKFEPIDQEKLNKINLITKVEPSDKKVYPDSAHITLYFYDPIKKEIKPLRILKNDNPEEAYIDSMKNSNTELAIKIPVKELDTLKLMIEDSSFISLSGIYNKKDSLVFTVPAENEFGLVEGQIITNEKNFILQLLDDKMQVVNLEHDEKNFEFKHLNAGNYYFRIIIDQNGNGKWDQGNITENKQPEPIIFYTEPVKVKANWEVIGIKLKV